MTKRGTEGPHREGQKDDTARNRRSGRWTVFLQSTGPSSVRPTLIYRLQTVDISFTCAVQPYIQTKVVVNIPVCEDGATGETCEGRCGQCLHIGFPEGGDTSV